MIKRQLFEEKGPPVAIMSAGRFSIPVFKKSPCHIFIFMVFTHYLFSCKELPSFDPDEGTKEKSETKDNDEEVGDVETEKVEEETGSVSTCPDHRCLISGSITESQTWRAENQYILRGQVLVGDGEQETRLTIEPGTRIYGERQTTGMLVIQRHSKLYASGTLEAPIVFSSDQPLKERRRGDWGGIILNGNAPVNGCEQDSRPCEQYDEFGAGLYGGDDENDNSGVIQYVRIEYAGKELGPDFDHGGLSLRGVGSATLVDHLHLHLNENDGMSMVGGTVDLKHILSTGSADDGFAWTDGWRGRAQYIITQQYDDAGDNGLEAANNATANDAEPFSEPTLYNATMVGVRGGSHSGIGILFKEGTRGQIRSSVVLGFGRACLNVDHELTWTQLDTEELSIYDTIIDCDTLFLPNESDLDPDDASLVDFFYRDADNHATQPELISPFSTTSPNFSPASGSPLIGGAITPEDSFFDGVEFVGAVDPEADWTQATWITEGILGKMADDSDAAANDVKNELECTGTVCIASGTFTSDMHWTADKLYILRGSVFIGDGEQETNLVIDPGTEIHGESATTGLLVVQRNATITAEGTPKMPIVFTSDKPRGSRARGDWGGIVLDGNAPINGCNEAVCESWGEGGTGWYGGNAPDDNSGTLKYVRIEFAGKQLGPDNELNGLALQGVGSMTEISHLHLHMNKDDAIEFFGGTVSARYIVATGAGDDALDWSQGWQGSVQFFVAQQYFDAGDNGIEADNNGLDNSAEPYSCPIVTNFTLIGSPNSETSDLGILLREGTKGTLVNGVVMGFGDACLDVDHAQTWRHVDEEQLTLRGIIMNCALSFKENYPETDPENASLEDFFSQGENNLLGDPELNDPFERETLRLAPVPNGAAATGAISLFEPSIAPVSFRGGIDPDQDWISLGIADGWIDTLAL